MNEIICGDAFSTLRTLDSGIVQTCITSPPYFGLRDYGVSGQIGLEDTPEAYISRLVEVFRELGRVLRSDGTLWLNIGDSYAGSWGNYGNRPEIDGKPATQRSRETPLFSREGYNDHRSIPPTAREMGLKPKDLIGIPWMLAFALRADGWYLRSDIIWHKPNCMPESVEDRPTKAHEYIFLLSKNERYFYDADAIREPLRPKTFTTFGIKHHAQGNDPLGKVKSDNWGRTVPERQPRLAADGSIAGANKRSVWTVSTHAYGEAHFATFPPKLIEPCILAGTSPRACEQCGAPWERVLSAAIGWQPTCSHTNEGTAKCIVLDPFCGAGTVPLVALEHHRQYIGIELNPAYVELINKRIDTVQPHLWEVSA